MMKRNVVAVVVLVANSRTFSSPTFAFIAGGGKKTLQGKKSQTVN